MALKWQWKGSHLPSIMGHGQEARERLEEAVGGNGMVNNINEV